MQTRVSVRLLYVLLGLATAFVLVFNVVPAVLSYIAPGVLGSVPFVGPQQVPALVVVPDDGFAERWEAAPTHELDPTQRDLFPWADTSDGTTDALTGLPPVELRLDDAMHLTFWSTSWVDRLNFAVPPLATAALALAVIWLLWRIVRTVSTDEAFTRVNARRVASIGLLIAVGASALQLITNALGKGVIARSAAAGIVDVPFSFDFLPLWVGAVVLLLAEVLRQGVRLRAEVEGLV